MKIAKKIALRVLMIALLAMAGLMARPGVSLAQSALQIVPGEDDYGDAELRIMNPTLLPLCAYVFVLYSGGGCDFSDSFYINPLGNASTFEGDYLDGEGIFIVSSAVAPDGSCNWSIRPKAGLRSWMVDDDRTPGINAQDTPLTVDILKALVNSCS